MSACPMSSFNSWFILILQDPSLSCTGPKIFLNILRSNILSCCSSLVVNVQLHIRMSLQVLLSSYIFLTLNFYLEFLISLIFHMSNSTYFHLLHYNS
jgi:hypothetical protein